MISLVDSFEYYFTICPFKPGEGTISRVGVKTEIHFLFKSSSCKLLPNVEQIAHFTFDKICFVLCSSPAITASYKSNWLIVY